MTKFRTLAIFGVGLAALAYAGSAAAQEPLIAGPPGAASNTVVYDQAFFSRFEPNNAEDILRRIPGVPAILDANNRAQQERGFGSGGSQVLLEGRRFPGKANEITATLRRIPAANVERVELIRGASSEINVQSQGVVVNVVMRPGAAIGGSGSWEVNGRFNDAGFFDVDGLVSYSRTAGALTWMAGIERNLWSPPGLGQARWTHRTRDEVYYYPSGVIQELRPQVWDREHDKWIFTGGLSYDFANGDRLSLNGLYEYRTATETDVTPLIRYGPTGAETLRATELHVRETGPVDTVEVSGEYISGFGPGEFIGLFIVRRQKNPVLDFRNRDEPMRSVEVSRSESEVKTGEDIVRGSYILPIAPGQSLEFGAEGARNTLEQDLQVFFDFDGDGRLEPARIPIANPEVKELRGELFGNFKWEATERLSLDASLNYEFSKLTTNYPLQPERELSFLKPRLDARYKPSDRDQIRFLIERTVSQLDFANFVPRYNVTDDRVEAGNPALEPEKVWTYEVGYEHRLANDGGLIDLRAYYDDITDAIDKTPLFDDRGVLVSASGNIPEARRYGLEGRVSLRLGFVGLRDAQLSLRGQRQWSDVDDPFTGLPRRLADDRQYAYDIGFRHDVTALRMSYGFTYRSTGLASINSDLLVTEYFTVDPTLEAFVERALVGNITVRLELQNLTRSRERRWRQLYAVNATDGGIRRVDFFEERRDIRGAVRIRGRF